MDSDSRGVLLRQHLAQDRLYLDRRGCPLIGFRVRTSRLHFPKRNPHLSAPHRIADGEPHPVAMFEQTVDAGVDPADLVLGEDRVAQNISFECETSADFLFRFHALAGP